MNQGILFILAFNSGYNILIININVKETPKQKEENHSTFFENFSHFLN
jgi:hypothetical protein